MEKLKAAVELRWKYNQMDFDDLVKEIEEYTGKKIEDNVLEFWRFTGLSNVDFFEMYVMSDNLVKSIEKSK